VTTPEGYLLALWVHECRRVFADKLVNYDDKGWVDKAISDLCRQEFPPELCKQVCIRCCALRSHGLLTIFLLAMSNLGTRQCAPKGSGLPALLWDWHMRTRAI